MVYLCAIDDTVRVHSDKGISVIPSGTTVAWKKIKNGEIVGDVENAKLPNPPVGEKAMREYVEMMWWNRVQKLDMGNLTNSITSLKSKYPTFEFLEDGCPDRANFIVKELIDRRIDCKKIWALGKMEVPTKYINNHGNKKTLWGFHVAVVVEGKSELGDDIVKMVIDPAVSDIPIPVQEWLGKISNVQMTEIKDLRLLRKDYASAQATNSDGRYWARRCQGCPLASNLNSYVYFETDKTLSDLIYHVAEGNSSNFNTALANSVAQKARWEERMKIAELATKIVDNSNYQSILANYTLSEKVMCLAKYHQIPTFSTSLVDSKLEILKNEFFAPVDKAMAEAALVLCRNNGASNVYSTWITNFKNQMALVNIPNKNDVFKSVYGRIVEKAKLENSGKTNLMNDLGL